MADELERFCIRMLGDGPAARTAAEAAGRAGGEDRLNRLRAAVAECRERSDAPAPAADDDGDRSLAAAVARELAVASAGLTEGQRELLALRELIGLSYTDIAAVTGVAPEDVAPQLADARLALRAQLRGAAAAAPECPERDRALRTIAARQDAEAVPAADEEWLIEHLGICRGCAQAHAALLEAAARYRAWGVAEGAAASAGAQP